MTAPVVYVPCPRCGADRLELATRPAKVATIAARLCADCSRHANRNENRDHGTQVRYKADGCRCDICREGMRAMKRYWAAKRKGLSADRPAQAAPRRSRAATRVEPQAASAPALKVSALKRSTPKATFQPAPPTECGHERGNGSYCTRAWPCKHHQESA